MGLNSSYLPSFHTGPTQSRLGGGYAVGGTSGNSVGTLFYKMTFQRKSAEWSAENHISKKLKENVLGDRLKTEIEVNKY